jgi:adenosylcobinamide-phosphate synthase
MFEFWPVALALLVERSVGYPDALFRVVGHPVQWIGALITWLDARLNTAQQIAVEGKLRGAASIVVLLAATIIPAWMLADFLSRFSWGWITEALIATAFIAQKSMRDHVVDVVHALSSSLSAGRTSVGKIVGRDTTQLDESGVAKAALESLAENTADGIVAPVFWYAVLGLPGLVAYKAINTADSMIGHKSEKHLHFGFVAAKLDDLVNLPASRLTALFFAAAAAITNVADGKRVLASVWRDASKHRSPNAGWPEAAMAGALNVRFGGPRNYDGEYVDLAYMGEGRDEFTRADISSGLVIYDRSLQIMLAVTAALALIL